MSNIAIGTKAEAPLIDSFAESDSPELPATSNAWHSTMAWHKSQYAETPFYDRQIEHVAITIEGQTAPFQIATRTDEILHASQCNSNPLWVAPLFDGQDYTQLGRLAWTAAYIASEGYYHELSLKGGKPIRFESIVPAVQIMLAGSSSWALFHDSNLYVRFLKEDYKLTDEAVATLLESYNRKRASINNLPEGIGQNVKKLAEWVSDNSIMERLARVPGLSRLLNVKLDIDQSALNPKSMSYISRFIDKSVFIDGKGESIKLSGYQHLLAKNGQKTVRSGVKSPQRTEPYLEIAQGRSPEVGYGSADNLVVEVTRNGHLDFAGIPQFDVQHMQFINSLRTTDIVGVDSEILPSYILFHLAKGFSTSVINDFIYRVDGIEVSDVEQFRDAFIDTVKQIGQQLGESASSNSGEVNFELLDRALIEFIKGEIVRQSVKNASTKSIFQAKSIISTLCGGDITQLEELYKKATGIGIHSNNAIIPLILTDRLDELEKLLA